MARLGTCELCERPNIEVTRHHLIPRTRHKNKRNKKTFDREEVRSRVAELCRPCHKFIHTVLTEKELESGYNTIEQLVAHPEIRKFVDWIRTKHPGLRVRSRAPQA
jgi:PP-loop superfamily ATP-utilizing enzyme